MESWMILYCGDLYITIALFTELLESVQFIWKLEEKFIVLWFSLKLTNKEFKLVDVLWKCSQPKYKL